MRIIIIAGFLGSGKTTLVLAVTEELMRATGKRISIVVNDFGAVGIDGKVMQKYGLKIMELSSGCICCTLGSDLVKTVQELESIVNPDIVIIEPTGVADPNAISKALKNYPSRSIETIKIMIVIDAVRFQAISKSLGKQLEAQIKAADALLINKIDMASPEEISEVMRTLINLSPTCEMVQISALSGLRVSDVIRLMI